MDESKKDSFIFKKFFLTENRERLLEFDLDSKQRQDLWYVVSDLFLDTELDDEDFDRIAREIASSPFTEEDLDYIYEKEVAPVLHHNLKITCGQWGVFDRRAVIDLIRSRLCRVTGKGYWGVSIIERLKRDYLLAQTLEDWRRLQDISNRIRNDQKLQTGGS